MVFCCVVGLLFAGSHDGDEDGRRAVRGGSAALFAHSLVPIIVGYIIAHYLSFLFEIGSADA